MPPRGQPPPRLKFVDAKVVDATTGQPITIKSVNWFGFNNGQGAVDGLWAGGTDAATDFMQMVHQIRLLGFNAVRLPFKFSDLKLPAPDRTRQCRPSVDWQLKRRVTDPKYHPSPKPLPPPPFSLARPGGAKSCNSYMPRGTGLDRLLWTAQVFNAHGMYVLLDYHGSSGQALETEGIATAATFASKWAAVWRSVACLPRFQQDLAGRVLADILNEPDMLGLNWGPVVAANKPGPNWATLALAAMDAINTASPQDSLFLVSGTGQTKYGINWGNGFITDPATIRDYAIGDPNPFFRQLVARPYASRVAISPHCYPPSITGGTYLGKQLWSQLTNSFGYLQTKGYCGALSGGGRGGDGGEHGGSPGAVAEARPLPLPAAAAPGKGQLVGAAAAAPAASLLAERLLAKALKAAASARLDSMAGDDDAFGASWAPGLLAAGLGMLGPGNGSASIRFTNGTLGALAGALASAAEAAAAAKGAGGASRVPAGGPHEGAVAGRQGRRLSQAQVAGAGPHDPSCVKFPVIISEFGSNWEQASDVAWLDDFAAWVAAQSKAAGAPVGWGFWSMNANSGDTGGLVSPNWQTFMWVKIRFLVDKMGLQPWYL